MGSMLVARSPNIEKATEEMIQDLQSGIAHQHLISVLQNKVKIR